MIISRADGTPVASIGTAGVGNHS